MIYENQSLYSTCIFVVLLLAGAQPVFAQFGVRVPIKRAAKNAEFAAATTTVRRPIVIQKVNNRVVTKTELVRVSNLSVSTEPGAKVVLESLTRGARPIEPVTADSKGRAIFDNLQSGNYRITASKEDFETQQQDVVEIRPQKPHLLDLDLKPITYKLKIETNITDGEVRYAQAVNKRIDAKGSIIADEIGNYCIVKIQKNGEAVIPDLRKGYYNLDIVPAALEFERTLVGVDVPEDTGHDDKDTASKTKSFQIDLERKISRETFGTAWTRDEWSMPADWVLRNGMKISNSSGIALPRNEQYRYYTHFELVSNVKLIDGGTAGFALRAVDPQNYYLVQISGARAAEPNVAKGYIIRGGDARQIFSSPMTPFASTIASKNGFRVIIKGDGNGFKISIEDSETGRVEAVGFMADRDKTFQKGAVGVAARDRANFEVSYFEVRAIPAEIR